LTYALPNFGLALFLLPAAHRTALLPLDAGSHGPGALQVSGPGGGIAVEPDAGPAAGGAAYQHQRNRRRRLQGAAPGTALPLAQLQRADLLFQPAGQLVEEVFLHVDLDIRLAHRDSSQRCNKTRRITTSRP